MHKRVVVLAAAAASVLLSGCGAVSSLDRGVDYKSQQTLPPLEVPPDLTSPSRDTRYALPENNRSSATLSGYQAERKETRTNTSLLPQVESMRVERAGNERWLVINEPADTVWPRVKDFWLDAGFLIRTELPEAGIIETEWAENRTKIPGGMLRDLLGRVFEDMHSTAERDKFRTRLERTADGKATEVYISHRGMEEVLKGNAGSSADVGSTIWQPRPSDPDLEAEFLRRLMVRLGADEERAKQLASAPPPEARAQIVKANDGTARLQVNEPFDRAWRRVGLALDRVGFTVEDRDRQNGLYYVRYADADAAGEKPGLFTRILGLETEKVKALQYRIQVLEGEQRSVVNVLNKDGAREASPTGQRILTLLHEQLK